MMIDFDGHPELSKMTPGKFSELLLYLMPNLKNIEMLITSSSSNGIYSEYGESINKKGMHIYLAVNDGTKIKAVGDRLRYICWKNGCGYHDVSKVGSLLQRHLFDDSVYSAERLIFEAKPILRDGILHEGQPKYFYQEGGTLSTVGIELSDIERHELNEMIASNKSSYKQEAEDAKLQYKQHIVDNLVSKNVTIHEATVSADKLVNSDKHVLPYLFELKSNRNGYVTVQHIIDNVDKFLNDVFIDPLETAQGNEYRAKLFYNADGSIIMNSFRHGKTLYVLKLSDIDNIIENINKCDDINDLLKIIDNIKENNNITNNDYLLIKAEYSKKYKEISNTKLSSKELNKLFARNNYELREDGVYYHTQKNDEYIAVKISGYLKVDAVTRDRNDANFGVHILFKNMLNEEKTLRMPLSLIFDGHNALATELMHMGLEINVFHINYVKDYISTSAACSNNSMWITDSVGWYDDKTFVMPDKTLGINNCFFQSKSTIKHVNPYSCNGTLQGWQNIAKYCCGNPLLMLAVSSSFSGALLSKVSSFAGSGGGFHIYGDSSSGKSTISRFACSTFGHYRNYVKTWRATSNGLESVALQFNDSLMVLDEISQANSDLSDSIYMLANGETRARADKTGGARASRQWQTFLLSNGERTVESHMSESGKPVKAGVMLRLINVPVFGQYGVFDNLHGFESGKALSDYLLSECQLHHGAAGVEWINKLIESNEDFDVLFKQSEAYLLRKCERHHINNLNDQQVRALKFFALASLAGELATRYGITGWQPMECAKMIFRCFVEWKNSSSLGLSNNINIENYQILKSIKDFIDKNRSSKFRCISSNGVTKDDRILHNQAGYLKKIGGEEHFLFFDSGLEAALGGIELRRGIAALKKSDWLRVSPGRNKREHKINYQNERFYEIVLCDL
jgi:putative DNA primase/helicase